MWAELETELTARAWSDPDFARRLKESPVEAVAELGVTVPTGVRLDIRVQDPDTLYFLIPPVRDGSKSRPADPPNQMDLWRSRDVFAWILPEILKLQLLAMRQQYRKFQSGENPRPAAAEEEPQE